MIGLLLFANAFGLIGTILCTWGVCVESIYLKMYYFHSAGEIYFVCSKRAHTHTHVLDLFTPDVDYNITSEQQQV